MGREGFEKFVTGSRTGSPVVVLQDDVCFLDWVPSGRQSLIKDQTSWRPRWRATGLHIFCGQDSGSSKTGKNQ